MGWQSPCGALALCWFLGHSCLALTPESPEVKAAVAKGLSYIQANLSQEDRAGGIALAGLAYVKAEAEKNHPVIQKAAQAIHEELEKKEGHFEGGEQVYNLGLALIFLASTDNPAYRRDIDEMLTRLTKLQKPNGGWGYPGSESGDTSMTQYGVLGLWECYRIGATPPLQSWERVCNWLLRTQDPSGGFGYQGNDPGNFTLVPQNEVRQSLSAAGLGSVYICADHFGMGSQRAASAEKELPSALKAVKKPGGREKQRTSAVDSQRAKSAMQLGNGWFSKNFTTKPAEWSHYYYYAYERYQSFREAVEGTTSPEPEWYTTIATELLKTQQEDGKWSSQAGDVVDTAFAVLFLVRGTKKSIQAALGAGTLVGGRGLPTDARNVQLRQGSVVRKPLSGPADQLLSVMEDPNSPEFLAAVEGLAETRLEADDAQLPQQLVRLRKMAGGTSPQARAAALRMIAKTRDLNHVPLLIFALNDPDLLVVMEARDALRFISRKFESLGPEIPEGTYDLDAFDRERRNAIEQWKAWYLSIRPEHSFQD